jgi:hypothetical protein
MRHGGLNPWDDDIDMGIWDSDSQKVLNLITAASDGRLRAKRIGLGLKLFPNRSHKRYSKWNFSTPFVHPKSWPGVDLFTFELKNASEVHEWIPDLPFDTIDRRKNDTVVASFVGSWWKHIGSEPACPYETGFLLPLRYAVFCDTLAPIPAFPFYNLRCMYGDYWTIEVSKTVWSHRKGKYTNPGKHFYMAENFSPLCVLTMPRKWQ